MPSSLLLCLALHDAPHSAQKRSALHWPTECTPSPHAVHFISHRSALRFPLHCALLEMESLSVEGRGTVCWCAKPAPPSREEHYIIGNGRTRVLIYTRMRPLLVRGCHDVECRGSTPLPRSCPCPAALSCAQVCPTSGGQPICHHFFFGLGLDSLYSSRRISSSVLCSEIMR